MTVGFGGEDDEFTFGCVDLQVFMSRQLVM